MRVIPVETCDSPEEALRRVALPFFQNPQPPWVHSVVLKVSRRSLRASVGWVGSPAAILKVRASWPLSEEEDLQEAPCLRALRYQGDSLVASRAWETFCAHVLGEPALIPPPPPLLREGLDQDEDFEGSEAMILSPLLDLLFSGNSQMVREAASALGGATDQQMRELSGDVEDRLEETAGLEHDPLSSLPALLTLLRLQDVRRERV